MSEMREIDRELFEAVKAGDIEGVRKAIADGANPNAEGDCSSTPLHWAAFYGYFDILRILLENKANPNAKTDDGRAPLHWAARQGDLDVVQILLENKADPDAKDEGGRRPLDWAACAKGYGKIADVLSDAMSSEMREIDRQLFKAIRYRDIDRVRKAIADGASPNAKDEGGWTPLHEAAFNGDLAVVQFLLEHGADPNAKTDGGGRRPLDVASGKGYGNIADVLSDAMSSKMREIDRQLFKAIRSRDIEGVRKAIADGANPNAKNCFRETPLYLAVKKGNLDAVRILLERGADPNAKEDDRWTPLHWAACDGHLDIVHILLEYKANPNAKGGGGSTPLNVANYKGYGNIAKVLLEAGAK